MTSDHLFLYNKRTALNDPTPPHPPPQKNANLLNKVKTTCVVLLHASLGRPQFGLNSVFLAQKCRSRSSCNVLEFQCGRAPPPERAGGGTRLLVLGGPVQMRVSWCQRLDGRMLSTFSMMKLRGANSVLRNCRGTKIKDSFRSAWPYLLGGGGGQIKEHRACGEREGSTCVCALIPTCMDPPWPPILSSHISLPAPTCTSKSEVCV